MLSVVCQNKWSARTYKCQVAARDKYSVRHCPAREGRIQIAVFAGGNEKRICFISSSRLTRIRNRGEDQNARYFLTKTLHVLSPKKCFPQDNPLEEHCAGSALH